MLYPKIIHGTWLSYLLVRQLLVADESIRLKLNQMVLSSGIKLDWLLGETNRNMGLTMKRPLLQLLVLLLFAL